MENIAESAAATVARSPSALLSRSPSKMPVPLTHQPTGAFSVSSKRMPQSSSRSLASTPPQAARSGRSTPVQLLEMSITEQIARKTRKSTVLDAKNALLILAIPDYDDYKVLQPYSCRLLSNKSKFVGGKDFVTRHNPQEVSEFKKQYSREIGNLNRHRSVLAPPQLLAADSAVGASFSSSSAFAFLASQSLAGGSSSPAKTALGALDGSNEVWRQTFTARQKPCWVLTEFGIDSLIGPEYRITTRVSMLPALSQSQDPRSPSASSRAPSSTTPFIPSIRSPPRPETPLTSFTARESARIGACVDLLNAKQLATLARTATYSPKSRPASPPRSPYRTPTADVANNGAFTDRSPSKVHQFEHAPPDVRPATDDGTHTRVWASDVTLPSPSRLRVDPLSMSPSKAQLHSSNRSETQQQQQQYSLGSVTPATSSPTTQPFAMEISPPRIDLSTLRRGEVYLFPVRVRNVGFKQERFRVQRVSATCAGFDAAIAEASYDKDAARLAPGLAVILTLTLCFQHPGKIFGRVQVATEGVGSCEVEIRGSVR